MNFKKAILISVVLLIVASSLAIASAADSDNMTDTQSAQDSSDTLKASDGTDEIQSVNENHKLESKDTAPAELTADKSSNAIADASNSTPQEDNATPKMTFKDQYNYFGHNKFKIRLVDEKTKKAIGNAEIKLKFSNGKKLKVKTDANGWATYSVPFNAGKYKVTAMYNDAKFTHAFKIIRPTVKLRAVGKTRNYGIGYFQIYVFKKPMTRIRGADITLKVGHGKYVRTFKLKSDKLGIVKYNMSDLKVGKHKVVITASSKQIKAKPLKTTLKIKNTKAKIKAKSQTKTTNQTYTIKLTNKKGVLVVHDARLKIKITNGAKTKTLHKRTDAKGLVKLKLSGLDPGVYKLKISSRSSAVKAKPVETTLKVTS